MPDFALSENFRQKGILVMFLCNHCPNVHAIEKLSANRTATDCVPGDAARNEVFEAEKLNQLVGK